MLDECEAKRVVKDGPSHTFCVGTDGLLDALDFPVVRKCAREFTACCFHFENVFGFFVPTVEGGDEVASIVFVVAEQFFRCHEFDSESVACPLDDGVF